ncbi:TonB-dependent receptor [Microbulbifer sp. VAAF005]|uniref:TonB-dependent receptor n=1 Tax=Microbulbifer sp. VAAF005 TaxID=3034230 RepID=UPI0024ADE114|nr:TonB-dependent receptor [Microbulbifer sp. VAAF005]WHI47169.1 TonB-dependent receptor [Microbulbifer sp. VAAF005]
MARNISHNKYALLPLMVSSALASGISQAQEAQEPEDTAETPMETVVVVGVATDTEITPEELDKQQANDLSDIFRQIPSVSVGGSLGIAQKVYIRGMEDTLLNVTVDGAPQTGTLFHHIGRVSIEPELLQKVEVQAGAGEATSGAGAIGGAIRFETKDADDLLDEGEQFGAIVKGGVFSNDGQKASASVYGKITENWGLLGSFVTIEHENMEDGDGNTIYGTASDQDLAFMKLSGDVSENQKLSVSFEQRNESGELSQRPNWPAYEGQTLYPMDAERQTFVANHQFSPSALINLETTVYHTKSEMEQNVYDRWGKYGASVESLGFDLRNTSNIGQHTITYGVEGREDEVESRYLSEPYIGISYSEEGQILSAYVQDHWQATDALLLSFGVRYDEYQLEQVTYDDETDSQGFSPNIGMSYSITDALTLTAGHATAMRGKEVGDGFTLESAVIDPDLDAETVDNTELGLEYLQDGLGLKAAIYRSTIDDVILDQLGSGTYYENIGELETEGFELSASYAWDKLSLSAAFSHSDSELNGYTVEGYEHNGLANARGDTWNLTATYAFTPKLELGWNYTLVQDLNDIEVLQRAVEIGWIDSTQTVDKPGYQVHDLYLHWEPLADDRLNVNLAIQNLLNEHYRDHSSVADYSGIDGWGIVAGLYEAGRDIRLSVDYRF